MPQGRTQLTVDANFNLVPGALNANSTFKSNTKIDSGRFHGATLKKIKAAMTWRGKNDSDGPLIVGISTDLLVGEIAEFYQSDPQKHEDPHESEVANRRVYPIWRIPEAGADQWSTTAHNAQVQHIKSIGVPSWKIVEGTNLDWHVFNASGAALTGGISIDIFAIYVFAWERD